MARVSLTSQDGFADCDLPFSCGSVQISAQDAGQITAIMPFKGYAMTVATALKDSVGMTLPTVGTVIENNGTEFFWNAQGQWFAFANHAETAKLTAALQGMAAVSDQSDGWLILALSGTGVRDVLARLCPLDFDDFPLGRVARTEFAHIACTLIPGQTGCRIMVPRSYARAAVDITTEAMKSVAAQALL
ncbi:MAG: hypothetical protein JKY31_06040 [Rhodobacteraceae bacterium]|nr:hypothetical protein [Paracoccaceae bacterium]